MNERTKIDVSLDCFGSSNAAGSRYPNLGSVNLFQSQLAASQGLSQDLEKERQTVLTTSQAMMNQGKLTGKREQREDKEAELETLRSVKVFLTDKLKQNEQITCTF